MKEAKIFPKLFIGQAAMAFRQYLNKHNYNYEIHYIVDKEDLIDLIEKFSHYANYTLPVIISDVSFLSKQEQSMLLKFMDDSNLNIILLASRDNILDTIISRVKEFRKYYLKDKHNNVGFIEIGKAREMFNNDHADSFEDTSYDDKLVEYNKYNPMLVYNNSLVGNRSAYEKNKLLNILESNYER
jgi:hypothetical protein